MSIANQKQYDLLTGFERREHDGQKHEWYIRWNPFAANQWLQVMSTIGMWRASGLLGDGVEADELDAVLRIQVAQERLAVLEGLVVIESPEEAPEAADDRQGRFADGL